MNEKTEKAYALIKQKVEEFQKTPEYINWLSFISKFHCYSIGNSLLIYAQKPEAKQVAGFQKWKKLGRYVKAGEKGITILAPCTKTEKVTDEDGNETTVTKCTGRFFATTVFDVSQTDGKEIPTIAPKTLSGNVENFGKYIEGVKNAVCDRFSFEIDDEKGHGEKGYTNYLENRIVVHRNPEEQMLKTAVHEAGHALLKHDERKIGSSQKECEAESVAFVVCNHFGIDTSEYSTKYISGWKGEEEFLQESLKKIIAVSNAIIDSVEKAIA